ncbi:efflux RND transporter periplasmic adaptor subunit [Nonlabens sp. Asnod2-A12]|uniref:efflux RND transporter periplasmic adaptor subunit n=1 Tax=Nonlabens sp. Asnod2-A12 TaxID=3160578 RepID=UPI0038653540
MNKNIIYIIIAAIVGLLAGWLIFGNDSVASVNKVSNTSQVEQHNHENDGTEMWTCSMHPQIMLSEPGDCPICAMDLIPASSSQDGLAMNEIKMTENAMALANIQTTIIGNSSSSMDDSSISLSGKIATNEENNTVQASYFDGRIERLNVSYEGQQVSRGQLLATIYAPNLVAAQQELITTASLKESQPALYNAVRNKLKNWKLSEKQITAIETSRKVRENFPVYATVSGTVAQVMANEGDYVKQGQPILKVSNLNSVWADFDAYENQIMQFKIGQKIAVTTNANPNKNYDATVSFIDPILNTNTRTVTIRATIANKEGFFKPGMFVTGKIKTSSTPAVSKSVTIPASAVLWTGKRSIVYVKMSPNQPVFEMREITLGNRSGDNYQVVDGLENGDSIVTNGAFTVDAAAQLQGKNSMMNKDKNFSANTDQPNITKELETTLKSILPQYLKLKNAFIKVDSQKIVTHAIAIQSKLSSISLNDLNKEESTSVKEAIETLSSIIDIKDIEEQRNMYIILNQNLITYFMKLEDLSEPLYIQKCPMVNGDKGAIWLSMEPAVQNPYHGIDMLTCGDVIYTINE